MNENATLKDGIGRIILFQNLPVKNTGKGREILLSFHTLQSGDGITKGSHLFDKNGPYAGIGGKGFSAGFATPDGFVGSFKKEHYISDDQFRYAVKFKIVINTE